MSYKNSNSSGSRDENSPVNLGKGGVRKLPINDAELVNSISRISLASLASGS